MTEQNVRRKFNPLLALGILFLPIIFVWFLLRRGHSTTARLVGFGWTAVFILVGLTANPNPYVSTTAPDQAAVSAPPEISAEEATERRLQTIRRSPERFLELTESAGQRAGFDTVFMLSGTIRNSSEVDIKDPRIVCDLFGPSGTELGTVRETLFEIIPANGAKRFDELNMGFMASQQVDAYDCQITDAEALAD